MIACSAPSEPFLPGRSPLSQYRPCKYKAVVRSIVHAERNNHRITGNQGSAVNSAYTPADVNQDQLSVSLLSCSRGYSIEGSLCFKSLYGLASIHLAASVPSIG